METNGIVIAYMDDLNDGKGNLMVCPDCHRLILTNANRTTCFCKGKNLQCYNPDKPIWDIKELEADTIRFAVIKNYKLF